MATGFTVAEMVIGMSVLSLLLMLALASVSPALKITKDSEERMAAQREVVLALDRLNAELGFLDRSLVSVAPNALNFVSDQPYTGSNPPINATNWIDLHNSSRYHTYSKAVILRNRAGNLWRREHPYSFGQNLYRLDPARLEIVADAPGMAEKIFCQNVEGFSTELVGRSRVLLRLHSIFRDSAKPASCEMEVQIQMKGER